MEIHVRRLITILMVLLVTLAVPSTISSDVHAGTSGGSATQISDAYGNVKDRLESAAISNGWVFGNEWTVIGLVRAGELRAEYAEKYISNVETFIGSLADNRVDANRSTENSRLVLALTALGIDASDVADHNLLEPLADYGYISRQGINGVFYALLAFDCGNYEIPYAVSGDQVTRELLVETILNRMVQNKGWTYSGQYPDVDMTCIALQTLAPYYNTDDRVKGAVDNAIAWLSSVQKKNGNFASYGTENSESAAQVIIALSGFGIDVLKDVRFVKNGKTPVDSLLSFYLTGGGFKHQASESKLNFTATQQGFLGLVSLYLARDGQSPLFDFADADPSYRIDATYHKEEEKKDGKEDKKTETVTAEGVTAAGMTFGLAGGITLTLSDEELEELLEEEEETEETGTAAAAAETGIAVSDSTYDASSDEMGYNSLRLWIITGVAALLALAGLTVLRKYYYDE